MKKNKILMRLAASALLCGMVSPASAQDLPLVGGLFGGGGGGLPLGGDLPVLGTFLPFAMGELPASLMAIELPIAKTSGGLAALGGLAGPVSENPALLIRPIQHLALPVAFDVIPITEVLFANPAGLLDFFTNGGVLVMPDISLIPRVPLVNQPL